MDTNNRTAQSNILVKLFLMSGLCITVHVILIHAPWPKSMPPRSIKTRGYAISGTTSHVIGKIEASGGIIETSYCIGCAKSNNNSRA